MSWRLSPLALATLALLWLPFHSSAADVGIPDVSGGIPEPSGGVPSVCVYVGDIPSGLTSTSVRPGDRCGPSSLVSIEIGPGGVTICTKDRCYFFLLLEVNDEFWDRLGGSESSGDRAPSVIP